MSYRVEKKEKVSEAIPRIALEEIQAVVAELHSVPLQPENIHEARRHLKKVRALLRLVRKQFPSASFKKENETLRAAGKMLAPVRDARVISTALASLKIPPGKIKPGVHALSTALQDDCKRRVLGKAERARITTSLRAALDRAKNWPLAKFGNRAVRAALEQSFRRGRKSFCQCLKTDKGETFHEWRKRVKDLEYHLCLFERAWPKRTRRTWKKIKRLDDLLGEDHDLALLAEKLRRFKSESGKWQNDAREIVTAIGQRRKKLQQHARKIGKDIFEERPEGFVGRTVRA